MSIRYEMVHTRNSTNEDWMYNTANVVIKDLITSFNVEKQKMNVDWSDEFPDDFTWIRTLVFDSLEHFNNYKNWHEQYPIYNSIYHHYYEDHNQSCIGRLIDENGQCLLVGYIN